MQLNNRTLNAKGLAGISSSQAITFLPNINTEKRRELFRSYMSQKLLNFECKRFYDQWNKGIRDFRRLTIEGGFDTLLKMLGYPKNGKSMKDIRQLIYFQASAIFQLHTSNGLLNTGNLITFREYRNKFGGREKLEIIAGSMLTPGEVYSVSKENEGNLLLISGG